MNGAQPPQPPANGAAVNGVAASAPPKLIKKRQPASSLFMSTNNRKQARWQDQALHRSSTFKELESKDTGRSLKTQQEQDKIKIPQLANSFKSVDPQDQYSGFSDPRIQLPGHPYKDYKLVTTKRELLKTLRYHIMQLVGDDKIDIRNESDFTQPARLHRRNVMAEMMPPTEAKPEEPKSELDPDQRIDLMNRKEQRAREREANLAQVAPSSNPAKKTNNFHGVQQVFHRTDFTEDEKRIIKTNYEEALPWVLEDYDNKHSFIGENQLGAYGVHVGFAYEPANESGHARFRLVPVEKVYEFKPKPKIYNNMSIDDIMKALKRGAVDPVWLKEHQHKRAAAAVAESDGRQAKGLYTGGTTTRVVRGIQRKGEDADMDFEDDFADDEEGNLFGDDDDEDEKDTKKRIKEEQLQANFLDFRDQAEDEVDEAREEREAVARKNLSKGIRKALQKREGNYNHGSDSDSMTSTDSEEERQRLEQEKLKNVKKEEDAVDGRKSAMSSGANTPSGRREKHGSGREDGPRKSKKRPGSPNLSDASGTDASVARKKKRKSHHPLSSQPTPGPSRPRSPDNLDPASAASRQSRASFTSNAAGSDTDAAAMSDGTRSGIKIKIGKKEPGLSPPTSRAGSPAPRPSSTGPPGALPSPEDIAQAIPIDGITYRELLNMFPALKHGVRDPALKPEVMNRVKAAGQTQSGKIYPLGSFPPAAPPGATGASGNASSG